MSQSVTIAQPSRPVSTVNTATSSFGERKDTHLKADMVGHVLFEYDPISGRLDWSDASLTRFIFGDAGQEFFSIADLNARIVGEVPAEREAALSGAATSYSCTYQLTRKDGSIGWYEERGGWIGVGDTRRIIGVFRSIDRELAEAEYLNRRAECDELTGVLNRTSLRDRLETMFDNVTDGSAVGAYLVAGIDDVGGINSDFGFIAADAVIRGVADRLLSVLGEGASIGRVAGTRFGILLADASGEEVRDACFRLLNVVREHVIETEKGSIAASICLGAVDLAEHEPNPHLIMARAEAALDEAKAMGPSSWAAFKETTNIVSQRKRNIHMSDVILTALNDRRINIAFQPIVSDLSELPRKYECLVRMKNEENKEVPAPEFIPIAERLGLVHLLDRRVLELAINTLASTPAISLNVNVSMETVKDPVWAEGYLALLRANQALAPSITVELTETRVIDAADASIDFVSELKALGAKFAMDDFGAGYTSFRNLKALDIDILKIDGSFVTGVSSSRENQLFVRTLLDLARNFGMQTVAEWVDNEADAMVLKGLGVDFLQGFLMGRPEICPSWLPNGAPNAQPVLRG